MPIIPPAIGPTRQLFIPLIRRAGELGGHDLLEDRFSVEVMTIQKFAVAA
jgi:hypothetical protein